MKKYFVDYTILFLISGTVVLLDQMTKSIVRANVSLGLVFMPGHWLSQYVRILNWKNSGAAFGMLQNMGFIFTILPIIVGLVILYYFPQVPRKDWTARLALGLLLGGALGNLIDRLIQGYVTDFISILFFPVFNVADFSITLGVVVLFIGMWMQEREKRSSQGSPNAEGEASIQDKTSQPLPEELQGE